MGWSPARAGARKARRYCMSITVQLAAIREEELRRRHARSASLALASSAGPPPPRRTDGPCSALARVGRARLR
eukprot:15382546-Alexandrium_andersonii.AAC.1